MIKNLLFAIVVTLSFNVKAQTGLSNMSFETWGPTFWGSQPIGWFGQTVTQQTTGAQQGTSYVRIVTTSTSTSSQDGLLLLATLTASSVLSGVPYTQKPTSIDGFYKTSGLAVGDTAIIYSLLMKTGAPIAVATSYIMNNVGSWTSFSIPYTYISGFNPDTIHILGFSNNQNFNGGPNAIGSTLDLDNLSLTLAVTKIDEMSIGTSFMVYPNPASNELNIISKDETATSIVVTDVNGKIVEEISIINEKTRIDLGNYTAGIYFYSIENKDKAKLLSSKFVVTK